ncbi:hypothetical protein AVEN_50710-1 [Araneus ventricosus]|uniref:Uncharacterized protein n=1 Tax=Araneus ventricosus TaxID=182803 RepID=A0A4Y2LFJ7_ARAVE|nr:hypothetical protein AVEN_50710-1 [Araneus ventricosus]
MPFVPILGLFFPPIQGGSKVRYHSSSIPLFLLPLVDFRFNRVVARTQSRKNLSFTASPAARSSKEQQAIPISFHSIRNSINFIHLSQFPSVFKTEDWCFLPVFQKLHGGRAVNGPL